MDTTKKRFITQEREDLFHKLVDMGIIPSTAIYDYEIDYREEPISTDPVDERDDEKEIANNKFEYINFVDQHSLRAKWFMIYHYNATNKIHYVAMEMGRIVKEKQNREKEFLNVVRTPSLICKENEELKKSILEERKQNFEDSIKYTEK